MIRQCLFLVCCACICIQAQIFNEGDYLSDYPSFYPLGNTHDSGFVEYEKPEVVRQQTGTDMILKCNTTSCLYHKQKIIWEFKECQPDFKKTSCTAFYDTMNNGSSIWDVASGHTLRKRCTFNLHLENINESQSGLYRCIYDNKIIKTYEVEIVDSIVHRYSGQPPELLDVIPSNITINQNMQVIIQCKVYSKQPPVIWWFKQSDNRNYDIQYFDKFYHRINTTVQIYAVPHELNVYLSKLNIYHVQEVDSGVYVCVAMTESGKDYKDVVLKVITTDCWEPHTSFVLLFLIPLAFALIPVTIWLCYYRKKKKDYEKQKMKDRKLEIPIISGNTILNKNRIV